MTPLPEKSYIVQVSDFANPDQFPHVNSACRDYNQLWIHRSQKREQRMLRPACACAQTSLSMRISQICEVTFLLGMEQKMRYNQ